jgi:hypothetical protein
MRIQANRRHIHGRTFSDSQNYVLFRAACHGGVFDLKKVGQPLFSRFGRHVSNVSD